MPVAHHRADVEVRPPGRDRHAIDLFAGRALRHRRSSCAGRVERTAGDRRVAGSVVSAVGALANVHAAIRAHGDYGAAGLGIFAGVSAPASTTTRRPSAARHVDFGRPRHVQGAAGEVHAAADARAVFAASRVDDAVSRRHGASARIAAAADARRLFAALRRHDAAVNVHLEAVLAVAAADAGSPVAAGRGNLAGHHRERHGGRVGPLGDSNARSLLAALHGKISVALHGQFCPGCEFHAAKFRLDAVKEVRADKFQRDLRLAVAAADRKRRGDHQFVRHHEIVERERCLVFLGFDRDRRAVVRAGDDVVRGGREVNEPVIVYPAIAPQPSHVAPVDVHPRRRKVLRRHVFPVDDDDHLLLASAVPDPEIVFAVGKIEIDHAQPVRVDAGRIVAAQPFDVLDLHQAVALEGSDSNSICGLAERRNGILQLRFKRASGHRYRRGNIPGRQRTARELKS